MVMSHTQELVFLCMLNFFMLVQSSADGPEQLRPRLCTIVTQICVNWTGLPSFKSRIYFHNFSVEAERFHPRFPLPTQRSSSSWCGVLNKVFGYGYMNKSHQKFHRPRPTLELVMAGIATFELLFHQ